MKAHNFRDLSGQRFHRLQVLEFSHTAKGKTFWLCQCDCGTIKPISAYVLTAGETKSCGCLRAERGNPTHGLSKTRLRNIWSGMKSRCYNEKCGRFPDYGGRGITVCDEWRDDFLAFYMWANANGYADDLTIERKDNDTGYAPSNCTWISRAEQNANRRPAITEKIPRTAIPAIIADPRSSAEVAADYGVGQQQIYRIRKGSRKW